MSDEIQTESSLEHIPNTLPLPGGIPATHRPHTESSTTILVPKSNTAFLNPVQQYNRDLSVAVIRAWNELRKEEQEAKWKWKKEQSIRNKEARERKKAARAAKNGNGPKADVCTEEVISGVTTLEAANAQPEAGPSTERPFRPQQITILEALSATGLRSIRYAKEIPDVKVVLANDLSESACEAMRTNVALNGVAERPRRPRRENGKITDDNVPEEEYQEEEEGKANGETSEEELARKIGRREGCRGGVRVNAGDACTLMYNHRAPQTRVDVVDLDPYGTAAPFIDAAVGCIADGGLLCVTCTDLAVLAGSQYPEKCFSNYGGVSVNAEYSHEVALRLVLHSIASAAARYGRYITPLLSFSIDFYVRLFIRIDSGAEKVKHLASQVGPVYVCSYCQSPTIQPLGRVIDRENPKGGMTHVFKAAQGPTATGSTCEECQSTRHIGGPMWLGPIQDSHFAARALNSIEGQQKDYGTWSRMHGMLSMARDELPDPFYFTVNKIHGMCHSSSMATIRAVSALLNAGYKVSRSHASGGSIKTNAPRSFIFDLVREHIKTNPVRLDKIAEGSPARRLIAKEQTHDIKFEHHSDAKQFEKGGEKIVYYQTNPTANWGPGARAKDIKIKKTVEKRKVGDDEVGGGEDAKQEKKARTEEESANGL